MAQPHKRWHSHTKDGTATQKRPTYSIVFNNFASCQLPILRNVAPSVVPDHDGHCYCKKMAQPHKRWYIHTKDGTATQKMVQRGQNNHTKDGTITNKIKQPHNVRADARNRVHTGAHCVCRCATTFGNVPYPQPELQHRLLLYLIIDNT